MASKPVLGYWDYRGYGNPIRLLMIYVGQDYDETTYINDDIPKGEKQNWDLMKTKVGLNFPNVPYYIEGQMRITQSKTILRYLGRKHNLYVGNTLEEQSYVDMVLEHAQDLHRRIAELATSAINLQEKEVTEFRNTLPEKLKPISDYIGKNTWFFGDKISHVDFYMYEVLDAYRCILKGSLEPYPNLQAFMAGIEGLPRVKSFMASDKYITHPFFNRYTYLGRTKPKL